MTVPEVSAPLFKFGNAHTLSADKIAGTSYSMTGPGVTAEAGHLPVRGDLAHIKLAGRYFVPHYAVPMPHVLTRPEVLRKAESGDAEAIEGLVTGTVFNVLDIAGNWAWGQVGEDGYTGYLPVDALIAT
jgi:Bacterial dipeptidyl-peptidase Sh3 domain